MKQIIRCPHGIYMHPNFDKYREASHRLHEIWNDIDATVFAQAYKTIVEEMRGSI